MKVYEILSFCADLLEKLHENGIDAKDCNNLEIYNEYTRIVKQGYKVVYAVAVVSEKYHICTRKVYKIISKMEKDCQIRAV